MSPLKYFLTCIHLSILFGSMGQRIAPTVAINSSASNGWNQKLWQHELHIGFAIDRRVCFSGGIGYASLMYRKNKASFVSYPTVSFSGKFRWLKQERVVSPFLQVNAGYGLPYTGKTVYVNGELRTISLSTNAYGTFKRVDAFGSFQLGADLVYKKFHFQLGGGFQSTHITLKPTPNTVYSSEGGGNVGWIASAQVTYAIQWKKTD